MGLNNYSLTEKKALATFKNSEIFEPLGLEMKVDFFSAGSFE